MSACSLHDAVRLTMKPVGEPDAGDRHVRFDERGWETGRCRMAQADAHPRLYRLGQMLQRSNPPAVGVRADLSRTRSSLRD